MCPGSRRRSTSPVGWGVPAAAPEQWNHEEARPPEGEEPGCDRVTDGGAGGEPNTQSPPGLFYRRIKGRIGGQGAVTATAHKLAVLVYRMLKFGTEYVKRSVAEYEVKLRASLERRLRAKAAKLGFDLMPRSAAGR